MNIRINRQLKIPIYTQIAVQIREMICSGEIAGGSILPSERAMAGMLGVHRNTVIKAYAELKDEELIQSKQGVGYMVMLGHGLPVEEKKQADDRESIAEPGAEHSVRGGRVNWLNQIRDEYLDMEVAFDDMFQRCQNADIISMGSGLAANDIYDWKTVAGDIAQLVTEEGKTPYFYSPYQGDMDLRRKLVSFLSTKGIKASVGEIQILTETNQALDFIVSLLVRPGDAVIMEEPVSPDVYRTVAIAGGRAVTVPVDRDGIQCQMLENMIKQYKPRFIYVNSSFHDPTGNILSVERRKQILEIAGRTRTAVVEEDAASELVYSGSKFMPMKAYDTQDNVIYIYSFSLTFLPGLSLAFVVGQKDLIKRMSYLVSIRMVALDWLTQKLITRYLDDGRYYRSLDCFRENYAVKQELVCRKLDQMKVMGVEYERPRGGVYIWCRLPDGLDSKEVADEAYRAGVSLFPGHMFYPNKNGGRNYIRINYSYESSDRLQIGMDIFRRVVRKELARKK